MANTKSATIVFGGALPEHKRGQVHLLKDIFTIGRAPSCDFVISDNRHVSAKHIELQRGSFGSVILIEHSSNGTIVNGVRKVSRGEQTLLNDGDIVYLVKKKTQPLDDVYFTFREPDTSAAGLKELDSTLQYSPDISKDDEEKDELDRDTPPIQHTIPEVDATLPVADESTSLNDADAEPEPKRPRLRRVADEMREKGMLPHQQAQPIEQAQRTDTTSYSTGSSENLSGNQSQSLVQVHSDKHKPAETQSIAASDAHNDTNQVTHTHSVPLSSTTNATDTDTDTKPLDTTNVTDPDTEPQDTTKATDTKPLDTTTSSSDDQHKHKEDSMQQMLICSICTEIIHDCASLVPCNHKFCAGCFSGWMSKQLICPVCRKRVRAVARDHQFNEVINAYLEAHPNAKRTASDMADLDAKNKIKNDVMKFSKTEKGEDYDDDYEPSEEEEDEESDEGTEHSEENSGSDCDSDGDDISGFDRDSGRFVCRQCPGAQNKRTGAAFAYRCVANQNHFLCQCCHEPVPSLPINHKPQPPPTCCSQCKRQFCHLYWKCAAKGCTGCLNKFSDMQFTDNCMSSIINSGNEYESKVLVDYLKSAAVGQSTAEWFKECLDRLAANTYKLTDSTVTADTLLCYTCAASHLAQLAYQYRKDIPNDQLPAEVTRRGDCWWGRNCRTQFSKTTDHARRLNHICEQTRKK